MALFQYFKKVDGNYPGTKLPDPHGALSKEVPSSSISATSRQSLVARRRASEKCRCGIFEERIREIISTKFSKTGIRENLDPRNISAIRYTTLILRYTPQYIGGLRML